MGSPAGGMFPLGSHRTTVYILRSIGGISAPYVEFKLHTGSCVFGFWWVNTLLEKVLVRRADNIFVRRRTRRR